MGDRGAEGQRYQIQMRPTTHTLQGRSFSAPPNEPRRPSDEVWVCANWGHKFGIKVGRASHYCFMRHFLSVEDGMHANLFLDSVPIRRSKAASVQHRPGVLPLRRRQPGEHCLSGCTFNPYTSRVSLDLFPFTDREILRRLPQLLNSHRGEKNVGFTLRLRNTHQCVLN